jgi:hypothetical protein
MNAAELIYDWLQENKPIRTTLHSEGWVYDERFGKGIRFCVGFQDVIVQDKTVVVAFMSTRHITITHSTPPRKCDSYEIADPELFDKLRARLSFKSKSTDSCEVNHGLS